MKLSQCLRLVAALASVAGTTAIAGETSAPLTVSAAAPDRQALIVAFGRTPARTDTGRYRDLLRLLGFEVTVEAPDTRPDIAAAFAGFAKRIRPGGDVAVFVLGPALPAGDTLWLVPGDEPAEPGRYPTEGVALARALRPIAEAGARETVVLVDGCRTAAGDAGQDCRVSAATVPDGVSAIVAERRRADGSGTPVAGLASLGGEVLPLMQREGLSVLGLYDALAPRVVATDTALGASPSLSRSFAFFPAGFLAGLPDSCNQVDPAATAEVLRRSAPVERLAAACAAAVARWSFSSWFRLRLAAIPEQAAFQKAAAGCGTAAIQAYLAEYPDGRYVGAVRASEEACAAERRRAQAAMAPPPPPPASQADTEEPRHTLPVPPPTTLVDRLSHGVWATGSSANCGIASKMYRLTGDGFSVTWHDGVGNLDVEKVIESDGNGLRTQTIDSIHSNGKPVALGTRWSYGSAGPSGVQIRSSAGSAFVLVKCR